MSEATRELFDTLAKMLLRCWIIGLILQLMLIGGVLSMGEMIHNWHGMFGLSNHEADMNTAGYAALLKLCVGVFFFVPWLAIRLVFKTPKD